MISHRADILDKLRERKLAAQIDFVYEEQMLKIAIVRAIYPIATSSFFENIKNGVEIILKGYGFQKHLTGYWVKTGITRPEEYMNLIEAHLEQEKIHYKRIPLKGKIIGEFKIYAT